jgi:hypothetical protein
MKNSRSAQRGSVDIGRLIGIVISLLILGLLGYAAWWVTKSMGEAGSQYGEALVDAKRKALAIQCQTNMRAIWQNLRMYEIEKEGFPPSLETLVDWGADAQLFRCPDSDGDQYVYIPGRLQDTTGRNVLLYESKAVHEGLCNLLRANGQIELLTPEQVEAAVAETQAMLRNRR